MASLEFWYDFAPTYSYLSAMRIEAAARRAGIDVHWRPFLLGPIFQAQGWTTSPFNIYPAKGRYMIRDMQRIAAERGLVFHMPVAFPANSLKAARLALAIAEQGSIAPFTRAVFAAQFALARSISDSTVLADVCSSLGLDYARFSGSSESAEIKLRLRSETARAEALGVFGAPSFVTPDGELFWGDDRLDQALSHAGRL